MTIVKDNQFDFRMRLCIRIAPQFIESPDVLRTTIAGTEVVVTSKHGGPPTGTDWIVLRASGFSTRESAREFGSHLRMTVQVAGICTGPGVDAGKDRPLSFGLEDHLREIGLMQRGQTMLKDIHGISVYPDHGNYVIPPDAQIDATVESDPVRFVNALQYIYSQELEEIDTVLATAILLLNQIGMSQHPMVRFLWSIVAVEPLGQRKDWSTTERAYLRQLATSAKNASELDRASQGRIAEAIQNSLARGPTGLKRGVVMLLDCLSLDDLKDEWKELYDERSNLIHGRKAYDVDEVVRLAARASELANAVVRAVLHRQGVRLPSNAELSRAEAGSSVK